MNTRVSNDNLYGEHLKYGTYTEQTVPIGSLVRGEVIRNNDPLDMGRVKVMIPSLYFGMPEDQIPWAPVLQQGAGAGAGSMIIPEVGTIAVVSFEGGRPDKPIVVGTVYGTGSAGARQVSNTIHCQNNQGAVTTANNRAVEISETPVQGQNLNTPVLYKSHNGSYIQFDNTTGDTDINLFGHNGDYVRVGTSRIDLETSAGDSGVAGDYTGSHLFMNDHSEEYDEKHGGQVELGSLGGFVVNMNDNKEILSISNKKKTQAITITQSKDIHIRWYDKKLRDISIDQLGIKIDLEHRHVVSIDQRGIDITTEGADIYLDENSVNIKAQGAMIIVRDGEVTVQADSAIKLDAPYIDLGGKTR